MRKQFHIKQKQIETECMTKQQFAKKAARFRQKRFSSHTKVVKKRNYGKQQSHACNKQNKDIPFDQQALELFLN